MATAANKGVGKRAAFIGSGAAIEPYKLDLRYASVSAFLSAKSADGVNSSSAEDGDYFWHTGVDALVVYDSASSRWKRFGDERYLYTNFKGALAAVKSAGAGAATGVAGDLNRLIQGIPGAVHEYHIKGTQTLVAPAMSATGLDIGMDQTDNDGVEIVFGGEGGASAGYSPLAMTVGTDAFFARLKFKIADVSGTDDCAFGFRLLEAHEANFDDYDTAVALNVISGDIKIETIVNDAATTTTDTTNNWADGETHTLEVYVSAAGVVTYKIDGAAPAATAALTLADADKVVPFIFFLHAADVAGAVELIEFECGRQL